MIKIIIKEGENIERALKRYKRKHRDVKTIQKVREAQFFTKPSVKNVEKSKRQSTFKILETKKIFSI